MHALSSYFIRNGKDKAMDILQFAGLHGADPEIRSNLNYGMKCPINLDKL